MRLAGIKQVMEAIQNGDITSGMIYTKASGMFIVTDLNGNNSGIIGHAAETDENGDPIENPHHITAADLIGAEF